MRSSSGGLSLLVTYGRPVIERDDGQFPMQLIYIPELFTCALEHDALH